ncbi:MAG: acetoacetate--CoA ligase [Pseudobdellovibrionaceae bacterium]
MTSTPATQSAPDAPLWTPSPERVAGSQLTDFVKKSGFGEFSSYHDLWRWTNANIAEFWDALWDWADILGDKGSTVFSPAADMMDSRFFGNAYLNYAENLLRKKNDDLALVFKTETGPERKLTYQQLYQQVCAMQKLLISAGVQKGDRVAGVLPNMPEAIIGALAAAGLGAIWSSASPDFGVQGILDRFGQTEPKVVIAVDGYYYGGKSFDCKAKMAEVEKALPANPRMIIVPLTEDKPDLSVFTDAVQWEGKGIEGDIHFEKVPFDHPLFIMFSSGTTGVPKCIVHGHGGTLLQHVKEHRLQCDVGDKDVIFYFTTCGWMMWNWLISGLACGATLLLYDGSPFHPDGNMLWEYTSRHKCKLFGTSAKYIDACKNAGLKPGETYDLSDLKIITSTGSPLVHESFDYIYQGVKKDVHLASIYGGTDIISASFGIGNPWDPVYRGELQGAGLATPVDIYDENGQVMAEGAGAGELVCTNKIPSMPVGFWNDTDRKKYKAAYFEKFAGVWHHGDWVEKTLHHGLIVHGRSDATLNPQGVRIGTAEIYRQVEQVAGVLESIAVGQDWDGDVRVILFVRLKDGLTLDEAMIKEIKTRIRVGASPRHVPAKILQVTDIPRTKSNKIVELAVREIIHGRPVKNKEALANPEALELYKDLPELKTA